jgi:hypothetical protein
MAKIDATKKLGYNVNVVFRNGEKLWTRRLKNLFHNRMNTQ